MRYASIESYLSDRVILGRLIFALQAVGDFFFYFFYDFVVLCGDMIKIDYDYA